MEFSLRFSVVLFVVFSVPFPAKIGPDWEPMHEDGADGDGKVIFIHIDYYAESYMMLQLPSQAQTVNCYTVSNGTGHTRPFLFRGLNQIICCHSDWVKKVKSELVGSGHYILNT